VAQRDESVFEDLGGLIKRHREAGLGPDWCLFLAIVADGLCATARAAQAVPVIDEALQRAERNHEQWCRAELLRIKGVVLAAGTEQGSLQAEAYFAQALESARSHGELSWELRAAISLGRLLQQNGRAAEAYELLSGIEGRFTEGFACADLEAARALISELRR
jgi:predicted ATPase